MISKKKKREHKAMLDRMLAMKKMKVTYRCRASAQGRCIKSGNTYDEPRGEVDA